MEWTEAGVLGAYRFTQRLFRLAEGAMGDGDDTRRVLMQSVRRRHGRFAG